MHYIQTWQLKFWYNKYVSNLRLNTVNQSDLIAVQWSVALIMQHSFGQLKGRLSTNYNDTSTLCCTLCQQFTEVINGLQYET